MRNTHVTIDLSALAHNLHIAKQHAPNAKLMAMVKANAYGHGASECLPALQSADALGVACLAEAKTLQQAGWKKPIILLEGHFRWTSGNIALPTAYNVWCITPSNWTGHYNTLPNSRATRQFG